jgi:CheY-like chemotaxis protein
LSNPGKPDRFFPMPSAFSILLIDDDSDDQEIFSITVGKISPHVLCSFADDGVHALERLTREDLAPDLIFIDLNMPRMGGLECLEAIRKMERMRETPAWIYSTSADMPTIEKSMSMGANGFLKKEANPHVLQKKLTDIFSTIKRTAFI